MNIVLHVIRLPLQEKKDVVESPMSIADSSVLSMSITKNESEILEFTVEEVVEEDEEDKTTAQTDREMFFHVAEYRQDIYEYMREIEVSRFYYTIYSEWNLLWCLENMVHLMCFFCFSVQYLLTFKIFVDINV